MASSNPTLARQASLLLLPAIARLAVWRFKQMWRFLFVTWLGMLAMVILVCALPLFSRVAISADLRSLASSSPDGATIGIQVASTHPSGSQIQQIAQQLDQTLHQGGFAPYLHVSPQFTIQTPPLGVVQAGKVQASSLAIDGYDLAQAQSHITIVQGRLPQATSDGSIEIALSQRTASALNLQLGATFQAQYPDIINTQPWNVHLVGIITSTNAQDPFWSANDPFSATSVNGGPRIYSSLAALNVIKPAVSSLQAVMGPTKGKEDAFFNAFHLYWSYPFDFAKLDVNSADVLAQQASDLRNNLQNTLTNIPDVTFALPSGSLLQILGSYSGNLIILEIVITILLLLTLGIVLFLVSILSDMLVERQSAVIATLRSRGATRRHVFGTFVVQGVVLGIAALLAGPFLAILLVRSIAQLLLSANNQPALDVITSNPLQSALGVKWYAIVAIAVSLFVMIIAIRRASMLDIVSLRRESSRTKRVPFWRRLNLDILLILLVSAGYAAYDYGWQTFTAGRALSPVIYRIILLLAFIAPPLIVAAGLMLFLRLLPWLLRLATFLASKKRSASAVLAFAQMERAPRPSARIVILLALAIASSTFLFTLVNTKQVRIPDQTSFALGADFFGPLLATDSGKTLDQLKTEYTHISGVQSATIGYVDNIEPNSNGPLANGPSGPIHIAAIDADSFANAMIWTNSDTTLSVPDLAAQLRAHRVDATARNVVYAVVDSALWEKLNLAPGASFILPMNSSGSLQMKFIALAEVNYIPRMADSPLNPFGGVGLLTDYQSFATVYAKDNAGTTLAPTSVMLRTSDDTATLTHIRQALPQLHDRRTLTTTALEDNIHLDIIGVLDIAIGAALILALIGTLLSSWLNAASRRTNFSVVRALGMAPAQVAAVLLWEQGFVYVLAVVLGIALAAVFTLFVAPIVTLLELAKSTTNNLFDVPPVQAIIPYTQLGILLGGVVLVCLAALLIMARIVSRPSISQTLRLNED